MSIIEPPWVSSAVELLRWSRRRLSPLSAETEVSAGIHLDELRTRKIDSLYRLNRAQGDPYQSLYDKIWNTQRDALIDVGRSLSGVGIIPLVIKGAEFIERYYQHSINVLNDIDILVPRTELERVKVVLHCLDYRQCYYEPNSRTLIDRDISDLCRIEVSHYELAPFCRRVPIDLTPEESAVLETVGYPVVNCSDGPYVIVEIDVHHGVATDIESEPLFTRSVQSVFSPLLTLSPGDNVWLTISRLYTEVALHGKRSLRDFAYVAPLIDEFQPWDSVLDCASAYQLHPTLYYYLSFLDQIGAASIPEEVLKELAPPFGRDQRDFGWQLGALLAQPDPEPAWLRQL